MTSAQLIVVDLLVALLATAGWLGAGVAAAVGRTRAALALLAVAVAVTLARAGTAFALAAEGWWFAQEKLTLTLPLLGTAGLVAVAVAGPRLVRRAGAAPSPAVVVPLLTAGYAAAAGLLFPVLVGYPATWRDAVLTLAAVAVAGLVTWRVTGGRPPRRAAAMVVLVAVTGAGVGFATGADPDTGGGPAAAVHPAGLVTDLRGPATPAPGGQVRRLTLTAAKTTIRLSSGRAVDA